MKSMTGYGRATVPFGSDTLTVQVTSVNRKTLDLSVDVPEAWEGLESPVAEAVRRHAARGKVHVKIELSRLRGGRDVDWDDAAVERVLDRLSLLAARRGVPMQVTTDLLWQIAAAQRGQAEFPELEEVQGVVLGALDEALRSFAAMRAREGEALLVDFLARVEILKRHIEAVSAKAPSVAPAWRENLLRRLKEAALEIDLADERVLKEVSLFADRCDIAEELTRFRSHLEQMVALLRSEAEIGRKAEFILQEMGREVNTIGSKANDLTISRHVIELKNELERIREQMANVE